MDRRGFQGLLEESPTNRSKIVLTRCLSQEHYKVVLGEIIQDVTGKFSRYLEENPSYKIRTYRTPSEFIKFLQNIGAYQLYLTSLMNAIMFVVTNKFNYENENNDSQKLEDYRSEVFTYLVSEMHRVINMLVCNKLEPETNEVYKPKSQYFFAKEAAQLGMHSLADRIFLQRICSDEGNPNFWFDYAVFHVERDDPDKAMECVREALSRNAEHKYSTMLFGMLLDNKYQQNDAETVFLKLVLQEAKWTEAWAVLFLFYYKHENQKGMDWALDMAEQYKDNPLELDYFMEFEDFAWKTSTEKTSSCRGSIFLRTAIILLKMRMYDWAELACTQEIQSNFGLVHYVLAISSYYKKLYTHALEHLEETKAMEGYDYTVSAMYGHCLLATGEKDQALTEYYYVLETQDRTEDVHLVYVNCAQILEDREKFQEARKLILLACKYSSTPYTWYKAGELYYLQNDLLSAEECFSEANKLDNRNGDVWGYLALMNIILERFEEADLCYQQAIRNNLTNETLISTLESDWRKC